MAGGAERERRALHAWVEGYVQGVGFRAFAQREARRLGLVGWVRNLLDGRVELWAEGEPDAVEAFLRRVERGPLGARVERVHTEYPPPTGRYADFAMRYDADP